MHSYFTVLVFSCRTTSQPFNDSPQRDVDNATCRIVVAPKWPVLAYGLSCDSAIFIQFQTMPSFIIEQFLSRPNLRTVYLCMLFDQYSSVYVTNFSVWSEDHLKPSICIPSAKNITLQWKILFTPCLGNHQTPHLHLSNVFLKYWSYSDQELLMRFLHSDANMTIVNKGCVWLSMTHYIQYIQQIGIYVWTANIRVRIVSWIKSRFPMISLVVSTSLSRIPYRASC